MNYQYGNKRQWRRWLWNRIADRVIDRKNAMVLFLAGEDAHDVDVARNKGFNPCNMIAVENNKETTKALRNKGILTIHGNILDVVRTWRHDRPLSVVVGDFCCGLEVKIVSGLVGASLTNPSLWDSVIAVNFLRGRDASSNFLRNGLKAEDPDFQSKHRAAVFFNTMIAVAAAPTPDFDNNYTAEYAECLSLLALPDFTSYKSTAGSQVFDTGVFVNPIGKIFGGLDKKYGTDSSKVMPDKGVNTAQRRMTAAVLAHHSRRAQDVARAG